MNEDERIYSKEADVTVVSSGAGPVAIRWGAIVLIVIAILYFLARYVIPLI